MAAILLLVALAITRITLGALLYFFAAITLMVIYAVLRKHYEYYLIKWAPVIVIGMELLLLSLGIGHAGHLVGSISSLIVALLVMGDERPKQALINRLGLSSARDRSRVRSLFFTYGQVDKIEKLELGTSYLTLKDDSIFFTIRIKTNERVLMKIDTADIEETYMRQMTSKNPVHYPSTRDLFLPARKLRTIGRPFLRDYFLVIRTREDDWTFFEEPSVLIDLHEEIERIRGLPPPNS
ncbi:MAG TPA: hypothetical protein DCE14_02185 [Kosmotogaceae bacterium]|nr:MAG: Uncharacterized protein XE05_0609 [Thermotogales bacterium 46_20]HAA85141.1 hypothetical protein [Kosmotogaceae bacterium]